MMPSVDYLILAGRNDYRSVPDFDKIYDFFETLYINGRLQLPLKGIVLIGYWGHPLSILEIYIQQPRKISKKSVTLLKITIKWAR